MTLRIKLISIIFWAIIFACSRNDDNNKQHIAKQAEQQNTVHKIQVAEVLQAANYTYIKAMERDRSYWIAVKKRDAEPGETLYYTGGLLMKNFKSKPLDRTFAEIYFLQQISSNPVDLMQAPDTKPVAAKTLPIPESVEMIAGEVSLAELFGDMEKFRNKRITVRGKVSKAMSGILGRTFFHLVDNDDGAQHDLTVTTKNAVKVNDVITAQGVITLNKDFGSGYFYKIIMENAEITN